MQRYTKTIQAAAILALLVPGLAVAQPAPGAPTVGQRFDHQQQRIDQGVASGALTHHEAVRDESHLKSDEALRNRQKARDDGGPLTAAQRSRDNRKLNNNSQRIYDTKHNGRVAPPR